MGKDTKKTAQVHSKYSQMQYALTTTPPSVYALAIFILLYCFLDPG